MPLPRVTASVHVHNDTALPSVRTAAQRRQLQDAAHVLCCALSHIRSSLAVPVALAAVGSPVLPAQARCSCWAGVTTKSK
jgi:hypothetical protein